jgi:hypothetical protein
MSQHFTGKHILTRRIIDAILLLVVLLIIWVAGSEIFYLGPRGEGDREKIEAFTSISLAELGQASWQVGAIGLGRGGTVYKVTVVAENQQELFKFDVDAATGQLLGKGRKAGGGLETSPTVTPMPSGAVEKFVNSVLGKLSAGQAIQKKDKPFYEVPIKYGDLEVAKVRVDPTTRQIIPPGAPGLKAKGKPEKEGEKQKIIPKNLVLPLGWLSLLIALVSTLYFSWKRSLYAPIRAVAGEAKAKAITGLRRTLRLHMILGLIALGIAAMHVLNFTNKLQLSVSWLTLAMMVTVAMSDAFGRFLVRSEVVRANWRHFHVPYTILFLVVLLVHVLEKIKVLGD